MNFKNIEKIYEEGFDKRDNFKKLADYLVENYTVGLDDERKARLSWDSALSMAIGERVTKKKHVLTGSIIGVGATILTIGVLNEIKKLRKTKKKENESDILGMNNKDQNDRIIIN